MKEEQRLFLVQAQSAFAVYRLLSTDKSLHHCHALHYLQMATELLAKANAWKNGPVKPSHVALVPFLRSLSFNKKAQNQLGYEGQNANWTNTIRKIVDVAEKLQNTAPALAKGGPNAEYPWPPEAPSTAPVEYSFPIWQELRETSYGRIFVNLIGRLINLAEEYM